MFSLDRSRRPAKSRVLFVLGRSQRRPRLCQELRAFARGGCGPLRSLGLRNAQFIIFNLKLQVSARLGAGASRRVRPLFSARSQRRGSGGFADRAALRRGWLRAAGLWPGLIVASFRSVSCAGRSLWRRRPAIRPRLVRPPQAATRRLAAVGRQKSSLCRLGRSRLRREPAKRRCRRLRPVSTCE